jgi:predicted Rossmann fold flavoprotein
MIQTDIAIIGAGASGLMAGIAAAREGAGVTLLEAQSGIGVKLLATGGGRCNCTTAVRTQTLLNAYNAPSRFVRPALYAFPPESVRHFLSAQGVETGVEHERCVYPLSGKASDIVNALKQRLISTGARIITSARVKEILPTERRTVHIRAGHMTAIDASAAIIACGGPGYPALGGVSDGMRLARALGHAIEQPIPALAPLITADHELHDCAGISLRDIELSLAHKGPCSRGDLVFTHSGMSGPAALDLCASIGSLLRNHPRVTAYLRFDPARGPEQWREDLLCWQRRDGSRTLLSLLSRSIPRRLACVLITRAGISHSMQAAHCSRIQRESLIKLLHAMPVRLCATGGFDRAMACRGGVSREQIDPRRMESRLVPGVYVCGETLDIDGPCGGFNLQWAFASGWLAGQSAADRAASAQRRRSA